MFKIFDTPIGAVAKRTGKALIPAVAGAAYSEVGGRVARGMFDGVGKWVAADPSGMREAHVDFGAGLALNAGVYKLVLSKRMKKPAAQNFAMISAMSSALWSYSPAIETQITKLADKVVSYLPGQKPVAVVAQSSARTVAPIKAIGGTSRRQSAMSNNPRNITSL